jgi:hypothetical protein
VIYQANEKYSSNLSAGYTAGQGSMSVNEAPVNVPTLITVAKDTDREAVYIVTGKTASTLTGVQRLRGYAGNFDANTAITCLNNEEFINQFLSAVFTPESLSPLYYGVDGGSSDDYAVNLDVPITDYFAGLMVVFMANTVNTGAATLNIDGKGAKAIKKNGTSDLETNDIKAGQIVIVIYDGTNFQLQTSPAIKVNRAFSWYLDGTEAVRDEAGAKYIAPQNMTVKKIWYKVASGTATIRIQKGTSDIASNMSVTSTLGSKDSDFASNTISAGDIITLDITAASSPVGLMVMMECEQ